MRPLKVMGSVSIRYSVGVRAGFPSLPVRPTRIRPVLVVIVSRIIGKTLGTTPYLPKMMWMRVKLHFCSHVPDGGVLFALP
jgi:hypothetical protein